MWKVIRDHLSLSDLILFGLILLIAGLAAQRYWQGQDSKQVFVYKDNNLFGKYPLNQDLLIIVDEHNTVEIKDGKVRMKEADCSDKRCVKQGFSNMLPIICLPNHLVVEVRDSEHERVLIIR